MRNAVLVYVLVAIAWNATPTNQASSAPERALSGRNGLIGHSLRSAGNNFEFVEFQLMNPDGTSLRSVRFSAIYEDRRIGPYAGLSWSPDGRRIAFVASLCPPGGGACDPQDRVFTVNVDGTRLRSVGAFRSARVVTRPSWSPDGGALVVATSAFHGITPEYVEYLLVVRSDGSGSRVLTAPSPEAVRDPIWSSDGASIAYLRSERDGTESIWLVDPSGASDRRLFRTSGPRRETLGTLEWDLVDWFSDGRILLTDTYQLATITRADGELRPLLPKMPSGGRASLAPDESAVIDGGDPIVVRPLTDSAQGGRLPNGGSYPDWQPCVPGATCRFRAPAVTLSRALVTPARPRPRGSVTATAILRADGRPMLGHVTCLGHIDGRPLEVLRSSVYDGSVSRNYARGTMSCTWNVPHWARGRTARLRLKVAVEQRVARVPLMTREIRVRIR